MIFSHYLRAAAVLAIALTLAACGGKASFPINGTAANVLYDGLVLSTNGMDLAIPAKATSFSFPNSISYGEVYAITQKSSPAHQFCTLIDQTTGLDTSTDTAGRRAAINVSVTCYLNPYNIGGTITGLTTDSLTLTNGTAGGIVTIAATSLTGGTGTYAFTNQVTYGSSYGVTVLTQPTGLTCTVSNPAGVMGDAAVTNINVDCVAKPT